MVRQLFLLLALAVAPNGHAVRPTTVPEQGAARAENHEREQPMTAEKLAAPEASLGEPGHREAWLQRLAASLTEINMSVASSQKEGQTSNSSANDVAALNTTNREEAAFAAPKKIEGETGQRTFAEKEGRELMKAVKAIRKPLQQSDKIAKTTHKQALTWAQVPERMQASMGMMKSAVEGTVNYLATEHKRVEKHVRTKPKDVLKEYTKEAWKTKKEKGKQYVDESTEE